MDIAALRRAGHAPSLLAALLHFDYGMTKVDAATVAPLGTLGVRRPWARLAEARA
jgi:hypothetical protein